MPLIDDRGRVFGRLNIIDAALAAFVLVLLPVGYTATRLFKVRPPVIQRVEPVSQPIAHAPATRRVKLIGRDLRPYLKAFIAASGQPLALLARNSDGVEARLLTETPTSVILDLPDLKPGQYDVYIYDETQQVAHVPNAFTLTDDTPPPVKPREWMAHAVVRFSLTTEALRLIHEGDQDLRDHPDDPNEPTAQLRRLRVLGDEAPMYLNSYGWGAKVIEAEFDLPVRENLKKEWEYRAQPIRTGDQLVFRTLHYTLRYGYIGDVKISRPAAVADSSAGPR